MNKVTVVVKNYLKLLFRAKAMMVIIVVGMLVVVAALVSAFHTLLDKAEGSENFSVGYEMTEDSRYKLIESGIVNALNMQGIDVKKYEDEDPEELIGDGDVDVMVVFEDEDYRIVGDKAEGVNVRTVQYMLYNADRMMSGKTGSVKLESEPLEYTEVADAENYYGIIEIVYFLTVGSTVLTLIFMNERKNNIGMRFKAAGNGTVAYVGKLAASTVFSWLIQVFLATGLVVLIFDVKIGKPVISMGLLMLATVAFTSLGLMFYTLIDNVAGAIGVQYALLWFAGYLGGSFETYMYSPFPETIKRMSPSYYVNRSLVELSVSGSSDYLIPCVCVMCGMIVVFGGLGLLISSKKKDV